MESKSLNQVFSVNQGEADAKAVKVVIEGYSLTHCDDIRELKIFFSDVLFVPGIRVFDETVRLSRTAQRLSNYISDSLLSVFIFYFIWKKRACEMGSHKYLCGPSR